MKEEAPPLKKSIIKKVEKQYGKDNPKTYATLWNIWKSIDEGDCKHNCKKTHPDMTHKDWEASQDTPPDEQKLPEDAPANATGPAVAGTGSDVASWKSKKKKKKRYC